MSSAACKTRWKREGRLEGKKGKREGKRKEEKGRGKKEREKRKEKKGRQEGKKRMQYALSLRRFHVTRGLRPSQNSRAAKDHDLQVL